MNLEMLEMFARFIELMQVRDQADQAIGRFDRCRMPDPQQRILDELLGRRVSADNRVVQYAEKWLRHSKIPEESVGMMCDLIGVQRSSANLALTGLVLVHLSMLTEACGGRIVWDPRRTGTVDLEKYRRAIVLLHQ